MKATKVMLELPLGENPLRIKSTLRLQIASMSFGLWAFHPQWGVNTRLGYGVTHVPTGMSMGQYPLTEKQASRIAQRLSEFQILADLTVKKVVAGWCGTLDDRCLFEALIAEATA